MGERRETKREIGETRETKRERWERRGRQSGRGGEMRETKRERWGDVLDKEGDMGDRRETKREMGETRETKRDRWGRRGRQREEEGRGGRQRGREGGERKREKDTHRITHRINTHRIKSTRGLIRAQEMSHECDSQDLNRLRQLSPSMQVNTSCTNSGKGTKVLLSLKKA